MTGIIVIFFNNSDFLIKQHDHLKAFCKDEYNLIAIDNSSDKEKSAFIKHHAERLGVEYVRTNSATIDPSQSHAFAASVAYSKYSSKYDILFYLDHDCFSVKPFSPAEILQDKSLAGLGQQRNGVKYFWPGLFMFRTSVEIDWQMIPGFDTGGGTQKAIKEVGEDQCVFFDEQYSQNVGFNKSQYNFYSLLHDGTFMHFVNGSNWANSAENEERINSLFNILSEYLAR